MDAAKPVCLRAVKTSQSRANETSHFEEHIALRVVQTGSKDNEGSSLSGGNGGVAMLLQQTSSTPFRLVLSVVLCQRAPVFDFNGPERQMMRGGMLPSSSNATAKRQVNAHLHGSVFPFDEQRGCASRNPAGSWLGEGCFGGTVPGQVQYHRSVGSRCCGWSHPLIDIDAFQGRGRMGGVNHGKDFTPALRSALLHAHR